MPRARFIAASLLFAALLACPTTGAFAMQPPKRTAALPEKATAAEPTAKGAAAAAAEAGPAASGPATAEPNVTVKPPPSYYTKKILSFPFEIPAYVLRGLTFPLGAASRYLERSGVADKVANGLSNKKHTFWVYPIIEGGAGSGFGGGAGIRDTDLFHKNYQLSAHYTIHVNLDQHAAFTFWQPKAFEVAGVPVSWTVGTQWQRITGQDFFGVGNDSSLNNHTQYLWNQTDVTGELAFHPLRTLLVGFDLGYSIATTGPSQWGSYPSAQTLFPPSQLTTFGTWRNYFLAGARIRHDTRDSPSAPNRGGLREASFTRFQYLGDGSYSYNRYFLDLKQFFPLWAPRYVFALHMALAQEQVTGANVVPFYRLSILGYDSPLRGFNRSRFADRGSIVFNAEFRFPLWNTMDGVIFGDTGRVFPMLSDFSFKGFKADGGGGLRFQALGLMLLRVDVAYGGEGVVAAFGVSKLL